MTRRVGMIGLIASIASALPLLAAGEAAAARPQVHTIVISRMQFGPVPGAIEKGDTIVWVNRDMVAHTATARNGSFDVEIQANQSRRMTLVRTGVFDFYCRYHPGMKGRLSVS